MRAGAAAGDHFTARDLERTAKQERDYLGAAEYCAWHTDAVQQPVRSAQRLLQEAGVARQRKALRVVRDAIEAYLQLSGSTVVDARLSHEALQQVRVAGYQCLVPGGYWTAELSALVGSAAEAWKTQRREAFETIAPGSVQSRATRGRRGQSFPPLFGEKMDWVEGAVPRLEASLRPDESFLGYDPFDFRPHGPAMAHEPTRAGGVVACTDQRLLFATGYEIVPVVALSWNAINLVEGSPRPRGMSALVVITSNGRTYRWETDEATAESIARAWRRHR